MSLYEFSPNVRDEVVWTPTGEDEHQWWPRTLWVDPGVVTGVAVVWFHPERLLDPTTPLVRSVLAWQGMFLHGPENDQVRQVIRMARELGGDTGLTVGVETFHLQKMNTDAEALSPVRIRSKIDFALWNGVRDHDGENRRRPIFGHSASDAKRTFTDERLRTLHMYTKGPDHVRDATRHALLHLRRVRGMSRDAFEDMYGWEDGWEEDET